MVYNNNYAWMQFEARPISLLVKIYIIKINIKLRKLADDMSLKCTQKSRLNITV